MATPTVSHAMVLDRIGDNDSPNDPNVFTLGEIATVLADSTAVSNITSQVTSAAASGALNSIPVSTADSKAVSAGTRASVADSKAVSDSTVISTADSKALSVSVNTSVADSKAVSVAGATVVDEIPNYPIISGETSVQNRTYVWGDVRRYGAVGDGATDDTTAIQAAIDAMSNAFGGGDVVFDAATYLVGTLRLKSLVHLRGAGMDATVLYAKNSLNADVIVLNSVSVYSVGIHDLTVDGNKTNNSSGSCVVFDNTSAGTFANGWVTPCQAMSDVRLQNATEYGYRNEGAGQSNVLYNVLSMQAGVHGFYCNGFDAYYVNCVASTAQQAGFYIDAANNTFVSCKSFYAGRGMTSGSDIGDGFYIIAARNRLSACEAQDNGRHGFYLTSSGAVQNTLMGCHGARNGEKGFGTPIGLKFDTNSADNDAIGFEATNTTGTQAYGVMFTNGAVRNTVSGRIVDQTSGLVTGTISGNGFVVNGQRGTVLENTSVSGTYTANPINARTHLLTLTGNTTIANPSSANRYFGAELEFTFIQDATGGRTISWGTDFDYNWSVNKLASAMSSITFRWTGAKWAQIGARKPTGGTVRVPTTLAAGDTADYAITLPCDVLKLTADAGGSALTGLVAGEDCQPIDIVATSTSGTLTLKNENAGSVAANRFQSATGANVALAAGDCARIIYDTTSARWRIVNVQT